MKKHILFLVAGLALAACDNAEKAPPPSAPQAEIPAEAVDYFSHMNVLETDGSKGQIILQSGETVWFGNIRQMLSYLRLPETANQPMQAYASLSRTDGMQGDGNWQWTPVENLYFVQSDKAPELIGKDDYFTFADEQAARAFAETHTGRVLRLADISDSDLGIAQ